MEQRLLAELGRRGAASAARLEEARRRSETGRLLATCLLEAGVRPGDVLAALARASGLPPAPRARLRLAPATVPAATSAETFARLRAAPFGIERGVLQIAFADPSLASSPDAGALPPHRAHAALEPDVEAAWVLLFAPSHQPAAPEVEAPVAAAPAASEAPRTIITFPSKRTRADPGGAPAAPAAPERGEGSDGKTGVWGVPVPPPAPPARPPHPASGATRIPEGSEEGRDGRTGVWGRPTSPDDAARAARAGPEPQERTGVWGAVAIPGAPAGGGSAPAGPSDGRTGVWGSAAPAGAGGPRVIGDALLPAAGGPPVAGTLERLERATRQGDLAAALLDQAAAWFGRVLVLVLRDSGELVGLAGRGLARPAHEIVSLRVPAAGLSPGYGPPPGDPGLEPLWRVLGSRPLSLLVLPVPVKAAEPWIVLGDVPGVSARHHDLYPLELLVEELGERLDALRQADADAAAAEAAPAGRAADVALDGPYREERTDPQLVAPRHEPLRPSVPTAGTHPTEPAMAVDAGAIHRALDAPPDVETDLLDRDSEAGARLRARPTGFTGGRDETQARAEVADPDALAENRSGLNTREPTVTATEILPPGIGPTALHTAERLAMARRDADVASAMLEHFTSWFKRVLLLELRPDGLLAGMAGRGIARPVFEIRSLRLPAGALVPAYGPPPAGPELEPLWRVFGSRPGAVLVRVLPVTRGEPWLVVADIPDVSVQYRDVAPLEHVTRAAAQALDRMRESEAAKEAS